MTTTVSQKRMTATAVIINDFMFKCFEKGMTADEAQAEAVKYNKEIQSRIEGLVNEL